MTNAWQMPEGMGTLGIDWAIIRIIAVSINLQFTIYNLQSAVWVQSAFILQMSYTAS